jgi:hypothetical protein
VGLSDAGPYVAGWCAMGAALMSETYTPPRQGIARDLAFGGLFGAAALALPFLFHVLHLGHVFMPMYIPIMALAFFAGPRVTGLVGLIVPVLSAVTTGMPPLFPPVALAMASELGLMAGALAWLRTRYPAFPVLGHVIPVLVVGRLLNAALLYAASAMVSLPAAFIAGISFVAGWPGVLLMIVVLPVVARASVALRERRNV